MRSNKVIFELHGGIGNQLFQYAAGSAYSEMRNCEVAFDITHIIAKSSRKSPISSENLPLVELGLRSWNIKGGSSNLFFQKIIRKSPFLKKYFTKHIMSPKLFRTTYESKEVGYDSKLLNSNSKTFFGYFQTYRYCSERLRESLTCILLSRKEPNWVQQLLTQIDTENILILHARFFDKEVKNVYSNLSSDYYRDAIAALEVENSYDQIWLLTNDNRHAEETFSDELLCQVKLIEQPTEVDDLSILHLMVAVENLVIANSTFSWWGAYLGEKNKNVIAPREIFLDQPVPRDYYPPDWIQIC
jgi:hypothetical protein